MGTRLASIVSTLAVLLLGITAGAMLTEAVILVPYWESLPAPEFFDWYGKHASLLVDFYSPLEVGSAVAALSCAVLYSVQSRRVVRLWWVAAVLSLLVIATFFVYFREANAGFSERTIAEEALPAALSTWAQWQWGRVAIGLAAFVAGVFAMRGGSSGE